MKFEDTIYITIKVDRNDVMPSLVDDKRIEDELLQTMHSMGFNGVWLRVSDDGFTC